MRTNLSHSDVVGFFTRVHSIDTVGSMSSLALFERNKALATKV